MFKKVGSAYGSQSALVCLTFHFPDHKETLLLNIVRAVFLGNISSNGLNFVKNNYFEPAYASESALFCLTFGEVR